MTKFDSIIIGAGQAGTPLVFSLAAKGESVALIEKTEIGVLASMWVVYLQKRMWHRQGVCGI